VAVRHLLRLAVWLAFGGLVIALGLGGGAIPTVIAACVVILAILYVALWLPRSAHAAFARAAYPSAARRYRVLGAVALGPRRERAALLSRVGCCVAVKRVDAAERLLAKVDASALDGAERAVWLNNRACLALEAGRDPAAALVLIEEATVLRPDVPAVQHTRAMALLAVERVDEAIAVLDGMRTAGELPAPLEADRCRDLARAWEKKGQAAYAEDYRNRAAMLAR
jgi:predicted Zn-dependent protease